MNEITTTASDWRTTDKHELSKRIIKNSAQLLEDYVLWKKCGWSDEEFGKLIGVSAKTVKNRYLADARRKGLIESSKHANDASERTARNRALPVEKPKPANFAVINPSEYNDEAINHIASLVDEDLNIDTSSLSDEDKDNYLLAQNNRIESLTLDALMNRKMLEVVTTKYCSWKEGGFDELPPLKVIKNLLPELTDDERRQLTDILLNPIQL